MIKSNFSHVQLLECFISYSHTNAYCKNVQYFRAKPEKTTFYHLHHIHIRKLNAKINFSTGIYNTTSYENFILGKITTPSIYSQAR